MTVSVSRPTRPNSTGRHSKSPRSTPNRATGWKTFIYVTLPLLAPTTLFVSTIAFTNCFKLADQVIIMTEGAPNNASSLLLYYIYQQGFTNMNYGRSSTLTVIMLVLLMVFSLPRFFSQDRKIHYN